ncbi:MAG: phosphoethanolamine transferase, partial [Rickettsiales bacterium]
MQSKKKIKFATLWTIIYSLSFNIIGGAFSTNIFEIILATSWVFLLFLVATYSRIFFFAIIPFIFISSGVVAYTEWMINAPISKEIINSAFTSSVRVMQGTTGAKLWLWCGFAMLLAALCSWHLLHLKLRHHWKEKLIITTGFLTVFWLCASMMFVSFYGNIFHWRHPYDYAGYTVNFIREYIAISKLSYKDDIALVSAKRDVDSKTPLQVVLVIGEAVRADHLGIYGYERNTTPLLQKEKNLFVYSDVASCATITTVSVPCLMTRATRQNLSASKKETSFVSIFKKLGFETLWVSEQPKFSGLNTLVASIANEAEKTEFQDNSLTLKLNEFKGYFSEELQSSTHDKLAVFHMLGSHLPYQWMYPPEFAHFAPICPNLIPQDCPIDEVVNAYDNTIVFTDYFVKNVIDSLRDKNAIMVYVSDHGEYLGERGMYLHGQETEDAELRHIPMVWWASDQFIKENPEKIKAMRSHLNAKLSHDNIFHSLLDCAGVESEVIDKSLSIC